MNKEEIYFIETYEKLLDNGYCNCNEMNCLDNNSPRKILNIVKKLQQENKQLKEKYINTVSDYETEKWKTQRIKTLLENNYYLRNGEKYIIEEEINEILEILKGE